MVSSKLCQISSGIRISPRCCSMRCLKVSRPVARRRIRFDLAPASAAARHLIWFWLWQVCRSCHCFLPCCRRGTSRFGRFPPSRLRQSSFAALELTPSAEPATPRPEAGPMPADAAHAGDNQNRRNQLFAAHFSQAGCRWVLPSGAAAFCWPGLSRIRAISTWQNVQKGAPAGRWRLDAFAEGNMRNTVSPPAGDFAAIIRSRHAADVGMAAAGGVVACGGRAVAGRAAADCFAARTRPRQTMGLPDAIRRADGLRVLLV